MWLALVISDLNQVRCVWKMQDELLWAAAWLYHATFKSAYLHYIKEEAVSAVVDEFNWDLKYAGVQVLLSQVSYTKHFHSSSLKRGYDGSSYISHLY